MKARILTMAVIACVMAACGDDATTGAKDQSQTHWLSACKADAECGGLSCLCGVCIATCGDHGECSVSGVEAKCEVATSRATIALCGGVPPKPVCLTQCTNGCAADERCEGEACIPTATRADAGRPPSSAEDADAGSPPPNDWVDAGPSGTGGARDAGGSGDAVDCLVEPSFSRACTQRADCAILVRSLTCCEDQYTGIRADQLAQANAWKASCASDVATCSCGGDPRKAYTDESAGYTYLPASVDCLDGVCRTLTTNVSPCGPAAIACKVDSEICMAREPVDSSVQYSCEPIPSGCVATSDLCACGATPGAVCQAPFDTCLPRGMGRVDCVCSTCK